MADQSNFPEDRSGCGLARVAEMAGVTYDEVRETWLQVCGGDPRMLKAVGHAGVNTEDLRRLLDLYGLQAVPIIEVQGPAVLLVLDRLQFGHYLTVTDEGEINGIAAAADEG